MAIALERHDSLMRSAIESAGGYVFKTVGDASVRAFASAKEAVKCCIGHANTRCTPKRGPAEAALRVGWPSTLASVKSGTMTTSAPQSTAPPGWRPPLTGARWWFLFHGYPGP